MIHRTLAGVMLFAVSLAAIGCGASGDASDEPTGDVTVWSWSPHADDLAEMFEEEHPGINVEVVNHGDATTTYEKLQTTFQADSGAPDVAMVEYPMIPQYVLGQDLRALNDLGGDAVKNDFVASSIEQVTVDGRMYGVPLDSAPMAFVYRADIFAKAGIKPPKTWAEFERTARHLREAVPGSYIANSPLSDNAVPQMLWQAGAQPFRLNGTELAVDFTGPVADKTLAYWERLTEAKLVGRFPIFSPEWNRAMTEGTLAGWVAPAWGQAFLGEVAKNTAGKWRVAPMPTTDGQPASAEWGGSAYSVTSQSDNPDAAAEYAIWVNHDPAAYQVLHKHAGSFPVLKQFAEDERFLGKPQRFFGGQAAWRVFAAQQRVVPRDWEWSPFNSTVTTTLEGSDAKVVNGELDSRQALRSIDNKLTGYARQQGFTVP